MTQINISGAVTIAQGDSRDVLKTLPDNCIDSVVTDPPYALVSIVKRFGGENAAPAKGDVYARASAGFMGKQWDTGETAFAVEFWAEVMRVLKPGGHVIAASGTRTYHRLAVAIEDAGFEIRDMVSWLYGCGMPKGLDVAKAIDKRAGHWRGKAGSLVDGDNKRSFGQHYERTDKGRPITPEAQQWEGWNPALKPACEPWVLARKPLDGTVAGNVLAHGTGALNIDGCRIEANPGELKSGVHRRTIDASLVNIGGNKEFFYDGSKGRWPANVIHDGSGEATEGLGESSRYFYSAKASKADRGEGNVHPTVKPSSLMQYLCRLVTPPGGLVLDPFMGSGSTGKACIREGFGFLGIERESEYFEIAATRLLMEGDK